MKNKLNNLAAIIEANETKGTTVLYDKINMYKKSLYIYYKDLFCCEPVLLVDSCFNAAQYVKIVPSNEFYEAVCDLLDVSYIIEDENEDDFNFDTFSQYETINFNSRMLKDIL